MTSRRLLPAPLFALGLAAGPAAPSAATDPVAATATDPVAATATDPVAAAATDAGAAGTGRDAAARAASAEALCAPALDAWKDRARWRVLRQGMSRFDVLRLLGDPGKVSVYDGFERWEYPGALGARVSFDDRGRVAGWIAP